MLRILLAGGGTLGSVSPLVAIRDGFPAADYLFVGTKNGPERSFVTSRGIRYRSIPSVKLRRYISIGNFLDALKFPYACFAAYRIIAAYRPDVVLTAGSFVAVPVALVARWFRTPIFIHQQDVALGLANRILRRVATVVTTTFAEQDALFANKKVYRVGNPIRPLPKQRHGETKSILILGGSTGAQGLNATVASLVPELSKEYHVIHSLGKRNFFQRLPLKDNYTPVDFLGDEYSKVLQEASLVITRAGMSTLTELAHYSKPAIVIPIPNSHQELNARYLERNGAVRVIRQGEADALKKEINELLAAPETRRSLGDKLHAYFPDNAVAEYRRLILSTVAKRSRERRTNVHFIGIGGIGISALVPYFREKGYTVSGSDVQPSTVTKELERNGVSIYYGHKSSNIPLSTSLVLYSSAVPATNVELVESQRRLLPVYSYNQYLGIVSRERKTIAISGTHGKTTTTALTGYLLEKAGLDPMIIVGSLIPQFGNKNYRHGKGDYFVLEADEYRAHMLLLYPSLILMNNIEADHLDYYKNLDAIKQAFKKFASSLPEGGMLIKNADDANLTDITGPRTMTYGFSNNADIRAENLVVADQRQTFNVYRGGTLLGSTSIRLPGKFNVLNALGALTVGLAIGIPFAKLSQALPEFAGSWRRFELVGSFRNCPVYSDYAHHPTAIRLTVQAIKEFYPGRKLVLVYQPHSYDRTSKLFPQFLEAFDGADRLILTEVYDVVGRDSRHDTNSRKLLEALNHPDSVYAETIAEAREILIGSVESDSIIVIMGAGSIDQLARSLVVTP